MTIERLRALYGQLLDRRRPNAASLPAIERILALVERRGGIGGRLQTLDSVMTDRRLIAEMEILRAAAAEGRGGIRHRLAWPLGSAVTVLAAALVLAVGLSVGTRDWFVGPEAKRGNALVVQLVAPTEHVTARTIQFSWKPVRNARDYEIEVLDADGLSAFVSTVQGTTVQLPANVRLIPGAEYRWWVVARRADGSRVGAVPRRLRIDDGTNGSGARA